MVEHQSYKLRVAGSNPAVPIFFVYIIRAYGAMV